MKISKNAWTTIKEGKAIIKVPTAKIVSKELEVFYNPVMRLNRDISVELCKVLAKNWHFADIVAASGIRSIRFAKELKQSQIAKIYINDYDKTAIKNVKENLKLNKLSQKKIELHNEDASIFLLTNKKFYDYIDIDPFGSPNPFLDASVKHIKNNGILAVTATDTAALCGTAVEACIRKYWATPRLDENMKEWALRILARKVQLVGAQYEKALIPILSHATEHYVRIYFKCQRNVQEMLKQHDTKNGIGPMWLGQLQQTDILKQMKSDEKDTEKLLRMLENESKINAIGIYDVHKYTKQLKMSAPSTDNIIKKIKQQGHQACISHIAQVGIRSTISENEFVKILKEL